jgi:thiol reductant ABC exporter CydC subunit
MTTAGYLISRAAEQPPVLSLLTLVVAVRFFGLARPVARYLERLATHDLALRMLGRIRAAFYARIEPLAPAAIESYRRGDLLARMIADVDALQGLYPKALGPMLVAAGVGLACIAAAWWLLPAAGVALAAGLATVAVAVPAAAGVTSGRRARSLASARARLHGDLEELLAGSAEIVAFGRQGRALEQVRETDRALEQLARRDAVEAGIVRGAGLLAAGLTVIAVLALAVRAASVGAIDRVDVAALTLLALACLEVMGELSSAARELMTVLASGGRVLELTGRQPAVRDPEDPAAPPARPDVVLQQVTARYGAAARPVIEGLDLLIPAGSRVAIVGPSGVGKTTVVNLLLRFMDPESGRVTLAGTDIRDYRQQDVRSCFAVAGQEAHIFDSSIRENLLLAHPGAPDDDLWRALRQARIDDWVAALPDGLDTLVGADGLAMSGGQRQRLTVARALLSDAPILVLDEPTAHLDHTTAQAMIDDVLAATHERTVLLITHRDEGLEQMDRVVVLGETR